MLSRRNVLLGGVAAVGLAGCSTINWPNVQAQWNSWVDQVTALVAKGCNIGTGYIPTVETIAAAVAALFGPAAVATVTAISGSVAQVASELCSAIPQNPTPAFKERLAAAGPGAPIVVGTTPHGVTAVGYSISYGIRRQSYRIKKR